ncbi:MAG: NUDIX domain-containing protein [Pseudomonadota bacterium]
MGLLNARELFMIIIDSAIRNAARALIVQGGRILLLRKEGGGAGERYALPGGAQEPGETLQQALKRECAEEIGVEVTIRDLVHVADYFKPRDTDPPSTRQLVEFLFACDVPADYQARNGHRPDKHQVEVVWADLEKLSAMRLLPRSLAGYLQPSGSEAPGTYLGTLD